VLTTTLFVSESPQILAQPGTFYFMLMIYLGASQGAKRSLSMDDFTIWSSTLVLAMAQSIQFHKTWILILHHRPSLSPTPTTAFRVWHSLFL